MTAFLRGLEQPEYVHTLLNPLPIHGLAVGIVILFAALIARSRPAQVTAILIVLVTAASAWPAAYFGDQAYDRVLSMADQDGGAWLATHAQRADKFVWCYYSLALISLVAALMPRRFPKTAIPLAIFTLLLALAS